MAKAVAQVTSNPFFKLIQDDEWYLYQHERLTAAASQVMGPAARSGYLIDLPAGEHPYDWFISALANTLGKQKAAQYLGAGRNENERE